MVLFPQYNGGEGVSISMEVVVPTNIKFDAGSAIKILRHGMLMF